MATKLEISELDFDGIKDNLKLFLSQQDEFRDYVFAKDTTLDLKSALSKNISFANILALNPR